MDFHQLIQQLRLDQWPRSLPAAIDDRGIRRHAESGDPQSKSLAEGAIREWHSDHNFECIVLCGALATAGAKEYRVRRTDRYIRLSDNLLLGRFGPPTLP